MVRVVRPGGKVAILEFSDPHEGPLAPFARLFVRHVVPRVGALMSGARAEYVHLQNSIAHFPLPAAFASSMGRAGLVMEPHRMVHPGGVYLYLGAVPAEGGGP